MLSDLAYTIVYVSDMDKCTAFYRDVLGLPVEYVAKGWIQFKSAGAALVLHPKTDATQSPNGNSVHISFRVGNLDAVYSRLSEQSVSFLAPPATTSFGKHATMCDPEGNQIDLIEWKSGNASAVSDDTIVNDILRQSPEAMGVLEEHGIRICGGCIVLLNGSVQETADFSGLSASETSRMIEELNEKVHGHPATGG
ncbi:MAG: VOC family protein [Acidobacteriota bacterium]